MTIFEGENGAAWDTFFFEISVPATVQNKAAIHV